MPLETSTTIDGLNALWPLGTDTKSQGDDHLRLLKSVLQADAVDQAQLTAATAGVWKRSLRPASEPSGGRGELGRPRPSEAGEWTLWFAANKRTSCRSPPAPEAHRL